MKKYFSTLSTTVLMLLALTGATAFAYYTIQDCGTVGNEIDGTACDMEDHLWEIRYNGTNFIGVFVDSGVSCSSDSGTMEFYTVSSFDDTSNMVYYGSSTFTIFERGGCDYWSGRDLYQIAVTFSNSSATFPNGDMVGSFGKQIKDSNTTSFTWTIFEGSKKYRRTSYE